MKSFPKYDDKVIYIPSVFTTIVPTTPLWD